MYTSIYLCLEHDIVDSDRSDDMLLYMTAQYEIIFHTFSMNASPLVSASDDTVLDVFVDKDIFSGITDAAVL